MSSYLDPPRETRNDCTEKSRCGFDQCSYCGPREPEPDCECGWFEGSGDNHTCVFGGGVAAWALGFPE